MARPEPATDPLDRLISQSEATLQRIESLQKGRTGQSAGQRVVTHLTKHGGHIINLALAGCVFVVAYGQLTMKRKHEAELQAAQEKLEQCRQKEARLQTQAAAGSLGQEVLAQRIQQEIDRVGFRSRPALQRIQGLLNEYRARTSASPLTTVVSPSLPPDAAAAAPAAGTTASPEAPRRPLI